VQHELESFYISVNLVDPISSNYIQILAIVYVRMFNAIDLYMMLLSKYCAKNFYMSQLGLGMA
jgi:hypothetical protein